jgi:hypothetical protein
MGIVAHSLPTSLPGAPPSDYLEVGTATDLGGIGPGRPASVDATAGAGQPDPIPSTNSASHGSILTGRPSATAPWTLTAVARVSPATCSR